MVNLNKNNAEQDQRVHQLLAEKFIKTFSWAYSARATKLLGDNRVFVVQSRSVIVSIYQHCRTTEEIETAFERLREEMDNNITVTMEDTRRKLLENFDAEVHDRLKVSMTSTASISTALPACYGLLRRHELGKLGKFDDAYFTFMLKQAPEGLNVPAGSYYMSRHGIDGHRYRLNYPLAQHLLSMAGARKLQGAEIVFDYSTWPQKAVAIEPLIGKTGTLVAHKVSVRGADDQDHIILAALIDDGVA